MKGSFHYPGTYPKGTAAKNKSDVTSTYYYDDHYFLYDARIYNPQLSTMSLCLGLSAWTSYDADSSRLGWSAHTATKNVRALLTGAGGIGFQQFKYNSFWNAPPTSNSIGVVAANKILTVSNVKYTLIALAVRGGGYYGEWAANLDLGLSGEHEGFSESKRNVLNFLSQYIKGQGIRGNLKLWCVGYSRGGAAANLVAGALNTGYALPGVTLRQTDLFAYTFEAPQGAPAEQAAGSFANIKNIINVNDAVPLVAPSAWNFARYNDASYILPSSVTSSHFDLQKANMLMQYNALPQTDQIGYNINEYVRELEIHVNVSHLLPSGDPFVQIRLKDSASYTQNQLLIDSLNTLCGIIGSRSNYVTKLQGVIEEMLQRNNSYHRDQKNWFAKVFSSFTIHDLEYIITPIHCLNLLGSNNKTNDIRKRLTEKFTYHCQQLGISTSQTFIDFVPKLAAKFIFSNPAHFVILVDAIIRGSITQAHTPEVCLAWLRSQDCNYV